MPKYDEIAYWSEVKLDIIRKYASAYSAIMNKQKSIQSYQYIAEVKRRTFDSLKPIACYLTLTQERQ